MTKFNQSIFQADIDRLIYELRNISTKKFRFFNNKQHIELVERYYAVPVPGSIEDIIRDLQEAKAVIKIRKNLEANEALGQKYYGGYWHLNANVNDLKAIAKWMNEFTALVREGTFSENTIDLMSKDLFDIKPERDLAEYIDAGEEFVRVLSKLKDKLNPRSKLIFKRETGDVPFEAWQEQLYNWRGQLSSLHLWSQYLNTKNALKSSNAKMFVDSIEKRNIKKEDIEALVEGNFADSLLNILFVENHELATFVGELHENRIREFKDLDKKILVLNRKRIYQRLNSNIPKIFGGTENPQAKILAGEFTRKSGHMPVRKLLEKAGGMIKQIKPCFMMSPLSIAQYLDPTNEELQFDVVIFDEASQVKPEDALGAFMRGKTAVVMGDTQQLPPTSFFDQMSDAESDEEEATSLDMESILHLCKLSFPVKMLKWHYRSRHESLITVSNREFYDDDLLVYPSPSHNDPELGLKFHYNPNTYYLRGASSANPLEAEDVVEEIFNHFEKYGDTKSLGVGTFSVAQKNAILEKLEEKRRDRPEFEPLFSENKDERFFVKNLETIQGDERDVILISVGYGFDDERKMSLNFGPLNQDGGERRLNVLITRARQKCVVFSNFKASSMKLTANPPHGVRALREFLEYAENLTMGTHVGEEHTSAPFEDAIASFLEENGYIVDKQIGCAGFRVDLAIVDEENPGRYILGITTDGKMYASSKVARDRDRLREQVLEGLGWKLYHLWSTDWYRNRDLGRKKLLDFIEMSIKETRKEQKIAREKEEKRRIEAEKRAEELRRKREKELEEQKRKEAEAMLGDNVEVISPDGLDFDDDIIFVSKDSEDDFGSDDEIEFVQNESPSQFVEVEDDEPKENVEVKSPSRFVEVEDEVKKDFDEGSPNESVEVNGDSSAFDDFIFKDDGWDAIEDENENHPDDETSVDDNKTSDINQDSQIIDKEKSDDVEVNLDSKESMDDISLEDDEITEIINENLDESFDKISSSNADEEEITNPEESGDVNIEEFLEELTDDSSNNNLNDGDENEDTLERDEDDSENVQHKDEEISKETEEESSQEIDEDLDSPKVKFGSNISKVSSGGILSSIKNKFSLFNDDENSDEEPAEEMGEKIKDKLENDDFIYVDHNDDEKIDEDIVESDSIDVDDSDSVDDEIIEEKVVDEEIIEKEPQKEKIDDSASVSEEIIEDEVVDEEILEKDSQKQRIDDSASVGEEIIEDEVVDEEILEKDSQKQRIDDAADSVDDEIIEIDDVEEDIAPEPVKNNKKQKPEVTFNKSADTMGLDEIPEQNDDDFDVKPEKDKSDLGTNEDLDIEPASKSKEAEKVDLGSDEDYIYVDHSNDEKSTIDYSADKNISDKESGEEDTDVKSDLDEDKVDLGSDEDYIYVDHSNDEKSTIDYSEDENEPPVVEVNPLKNILFGDRKPKNQNGISESKFSSAIKGTSKLNLTKEEVETVRGEIIDDDLIDHKSAPEDDDVVEVEILSGDYKNRNADINPMDNINNDLDDENKVVFKRNVDGVSEMTRNSSVKEKDFNRIIDETFENHPDGSLDDEDISNLASALVSKAFDDVISDALNEKDNQYNLKRDENYDDYQSDIQNNDIEENDAQNVNHTSTSPDGVTYYKGIDDVNSPLRKNNLYYDGDKNKNKSVKDSIKSGIRDIKYIHKSLNEIENPTKVGYVSVVDRTEEYDESEYLTPIQDYEGEEYVPQDEGLTFAEKEELRYEKELQMEKLKKELSSDDNTIVTIHEEERREDRKDQALEDIIQIADEDYKEIEKERFKSSNTLKAFDDNKLPKRGKVEDEIVDYKFASDFGLNSQEDLYNQPIENVSKSVNEIIAVEGPIHINEVIKRIKDSCHIKRAGAKMKKQVQKAIKESENSGNVIRIGDFLYDASSNDVVIRKRVKPKIDLISDEEISKNIETILSHKQSLTTASLTKEVSRNFGFKSTSRKTSAKIKSVLDSMIAEGSVKLYDDIVELN